MKVAHASSACAVAGTAAVPGGAGLRYGGAVVEGFVYVGDGASGPMSGASVGARIRTPSLDPPWIVVDHAIHTVVVARWPGRLLRVASVPPAGERERAALARAAQNLRPDAGYTRVLAVDVLAELPAWILFGQHGAAVAGILERARHMAAQEARDLSAARHPAADQAFSRIWQRWLERQPHGAPYRSEDHSRVLAVPGAGPAMSPVGPALTLIWTCVADSAQRCAGPRAFGPDAEGGKVLLDPWATAAAALLDAAIAVGAPDLADRPDAALLTRPWQVM